MTDAAWLDLLGKYALPGTDGSYEQALWLKLPAAKQQVVRCRLPVIDAFLKARDCDAGDPEGTAKDLGISVRSLYRSIARIREFGPVAGLAPSAGAGRKRRSDAILELPGEMEASLKDLFAMRPDPRWRAVMESAGLSAPARYAKRTSSLAGSPVSSSTVRRRANALKQRTTIPEDAVFGRSWLIDQVAVDLRVEGGGHEAFFVARFLMDRETRLIGAVAEVESEHSDVAGMAGMAKLMMKAHPVPAATVEIADCVENLLWVLPLDTAAAAAADHVIRKGSSMSPPVAVECISSGKFRQGSELVKLIGDRLGPVRLLVRATANPEGEAKTSLAVLTRQAALQVVTQAALVWNRNLLRGSGGGLSAIAERRTLFNRLAGTLELLFASADEGSDRPSTIGCDTTGEDG